MVNIFKIKAVFTEQIQYSAAPGLNQTLIGNQVIFKTEVSKQYKFRPITNITSPSLWVGKML